MNSTKYILTIVVPVFNHEKYIKKCINSIINQKTKWKYKILIIDDCSNDRSGKIIENISNKIINLEYFRTPFNCGNFRYAASLYKKKIETKYIAFMEGDDYINSKNKFEKQISFMEKNPKFIATFHKTIVLDQINDTNLIIKPSKEIINIKDYFDMKDSLYAHTSSWIFKNIFQKTHSDEFIKKKLSGDVLRAMTYIKNGDAKYIPWISTTYRVHKKGMYSSRSNLYKFLHNNFFIYYKMNKLTNSKYLPQLLFNLLVNFKIRLINKFEYIIKKIKKNADFKKK